MKIVELTKDNYFSIEADRHYMSVSQFKSFKSCEARTMAKLKGDWVEPGNKAFLIGSYVHAWNEGPEAFDEFKELNKAKIYKKSGGKYSDFVLADKMINALNDDPLVEKVREGEKEVIMTAELFGVPWKIMIDIYNPSKNIIVDLKTTKSITEKYWNAEIKAKQNFIEHYDYLLQKAVYCEVERLSTANTEYCHPHIIAVSKEAIPDKVVIYLGRDFIEDKLLEVELYVDRIKQVKAGEVEPIRCETCDHCRATKQLTKVLHYTEI